MTTEQTPQPDPSPEQTPQPEGTQQQLPGQPPEPRTDLPAPEGMSEEDYQTFLADLADMDPDMWRDEDGTLHFLHAPAELTPGSFSSGGTLAPDDPLYDRYASRLLPWYDRASDQSAAQAPASEEAPADA